VIGATMIVLATLARPEHEPGIVTSSGLARLNVQVIGAHRDLSRHGVYVECKEALLARVNRVRCRATISMRKRWG